MGVQGCGLWTGCGLRGGGLAGLRVSVLGFCGAFGLVDLGPACTLITQACQQHPEEKPTVLHVCKPS